MCFTVRKINIILSLLLVVVCSWGQVTDAKNFTITPQTVVKTNLPKQAPCLFELQDILRERFGQSAIMGGLRAKGNSVSSFGQTLSWKGKNIIYSIYRRTHKLLLNILRNVKSLIFFRPVIRPTEFFIPE